MADRVSVDTSFLIDLQRERSAGNNDGPAHRFLVHSPETELYLSAVAFGEFTEGFARTDDPHVIAVRDGHTLVAVNDQIALTYARVARELRRRGALIGANVLWIGCTSLHLGMPVLTADVVAFRRIDGLGIIPYR